MKTRRKLFSAALALTMIFSMLPAAAFSENAAPFAETDEFRLAPEYEASLTSLLSQLSSDGIGISGVYADDITQSGAPLPGGLSLSQYATPPETPSGINPWTRVSYEIVSPGMADYEAPQDAKIRFKLENPGNAPVSFSYKIISGSTYIENLDNMQPMQGTVVFGEGETEKEILVNIKPLVNNPTESGLISDLQEYWKGERIFFLYCNDIQNAFFSNEKDSLTVPVPIVNNFNFEQAYDNAADKYLFKLDDLSGVVSDTEAQGKYRNTGNEIRISVPIEGDVRTLIDIGVFSKVDFPTGHISFEGTTPCSVEYRVEANYQFWDGTPFADTVFSELLTLEEQSEAPFGGERYIADAKLGRAEEGNRMVRSLDFILDYSAITDEVYTWFGDTQGNYPQDQVRFSDKTAPYVMQCTIPLELWDGVRLGETVPVVVTFNEPVRTDNISAVIGGAALSPVEAAGTISESVTFLYETDEALTEVYGGTLPIASVSGASDISGKPQEDYSDGSVFINVPFRAKEAFAYYAEPSVIIDQGESLQASGAITISLKNNMDLSNWLSGYLDIESSLISNVRAEVVGSDGTPAGIPLYAQIEGGRITSLTGEFAPPVNQTGQEKYYMAEIYLDSDGPEGDSPFELLYGLMAEYTVAPVIFIDDEEDFEIVYTGWPAGDRILADSTASLSLGCKVNVNATWQRPEDFTWSSSNLSVASINGNGVIVLTGEPGTVAFTLTALNAGLADSISITSRTLTVAEADAAFLNIPAGARNIEILKGSDAKVFYSTNIPARNDLSAGSVTATEFSLVLYEAEYPDGTPQKGSLVHSDKLDVYAEGQDRYFTVPKELLVNTALKGYASYILEISAKDLGSDDDYSALTYISVKPLPAKAVLAKPEKYYLTDEDDSFSFSFDIENKAPGLEYTLKVTKNGGGEPVFLTGVPEDIGKSHTITIGDVNADRLFDAYTVSLMAKNAYDGAYSFDSFTLYVYNADALKIAINGINYSSYILKPDLDFRNMTSTHIVNTYREISYTIDQVSINKGSYHWSNLADMITWEVGDEDKLTLKFNGNIITGESAPLLLPGASLVLEGHESGSTYIKATHALTGMEAEIDVTVEDIREKLFIFKTYPEVPCEVTYRNGYYVDKTTRTDSFGRVGIYEESGIVGDVIFRPIEHGAELYDCAAISSFQIYANQHSTNEFDLHPHSVVKLPKLNYKVTLELFEEKTGTPYTDDIIIRGGVWVNGEYRYDVVDGYWRAITTINGKMGDTDQTVSAENGLYTLNFNCMEFANEYGNLYPSDQIEYVIEVKYPGNSYYPQFIKVDNETIRKNKYSQLGVYIKEPIKSVDSSMIQNNAIVVSQTLVIDGSEYPVDEKIVLTSEPESIYVIMEMIITDGYYGGNYSFFLADYSAMGFSAAAPAEAIEQYKFSDTAVLSGTVDLKPMFRFFKPGQTLNLYPTVRKVSGSLKLSKPITIQKIYNIPNMSEIFYKTGGIPEVKDYILSANNGGEGFNFTGGDDLVKDMLDVMSDFHVNWDQTFRLEITPTDDPLVYKGIIRFAAGDYTRENPSGVFVAQDEPIKYSFMPGYSDMKEISKGDYLKRSREEMIKNKDGLSGSYKSYGGGAYMECEIRYDTNDYVWRILLLKSDLYLGGGITYQTTYNGWISFVPVTATFETGMTGEVGLKTVYDKNSGARAYITEVRPYFYVYGFAGAGFEYEIVSLKVGPYGVIGHEQRYLWYNQGYDKRNGQKLTISGSVGLEFKIKLLFASLKGKYELGSANKSWTYNDFNLINNVFSTGKILSMLSEDAPADSDKGKEGVSVSGTAAFESRSYLNGSERKWNAAAAKSGPMGDTGLMGRSGLSGLSGPAVETLLTNAYPYSDPVLTEDGRMMVYLHDMESDDFMDTAVYFTTRENTEDSFPEGAEIDGSGYPDSDVSVAGTGDNAVAVWTRMYADIDAVSGGDAAFEDIAEMLAGTEIMAAVYKDGTFTTARLTADSTPDMAPVVAVNGDKAIAAWRSVAAGDMEKPLEFSGRDDIMYSIYDGSSWSEPRVLYDGSIDHVNAVNASMLADGTMAVTYQITKEGTENTEIMCIVLDDDGSVKNRLRLTNNEVRDTNPQIVSAVYPDGAERFIIGWDTLKTLADGEVRNCIRLCAVDASGNLYTAFDREIGDASDGGNSNAFRFVKGARNVEDLSVIWNAPDLTAAAVSEGVYSDSLWGIKLIKEDDGTIIQSGRQKLLELNARNAADSFDAVVNADTGEINFALLITDYSEETAPSRLALAKSAYRNELIVGEPYFYSGDVLPGLDMPVLFRVENAGAESIRCINIELGGASDVFDEIVIRPGESREFTVFRNVPDPVENLAYSVTAQFGTSVDNKSGVLRLNLPDVGIEQINITRENNRERDFSVILSNGSYAGLEAGRHRVRLEVYDTTDFDSGVLIATQTISDAERLNMLNEGVLPLSVTLSGEAIEKLLDDDGEIPENGVWLFFRTVLEEDGEVIEDADIGNDMDYIKVYSLIEKNGTPFSTASMTDSADGRTTVRAEVMNNSMNGISNGNIIVTLKDQNGRVIAQQQTYDAADAAGSLLSVTGEDICTASFLFEQAGYAADILFSRIDANSTRLSVLRMDGVPLDFDRDVFQYDIEVTDMYETFITVAAENPDSAVSITRNGSPVSLSRPCALSYGTNTFVITVTTGEQEEVYTVNIVNTRSGDDEDDGEVGGNGESAEDDGGDEYYTVSLIKGGTSRTVPVRIEDGKAVVSLSSLADIFAGDQDAELTIPPIPGVRAYTLEMPADALGRQGGTAALVVNTEFGSITIPPGMLAGMTGLDGKTAGITIEPGDVSGMSEEIKARIGNRPVIRLSLTIDGKHADWNNPDAPVRVTIPFTPSSGEAENPESIVIWYIDGNGNAFCVPNGHYDPDTGTVTFFTTHFSLFAVGYNRVVFGDVQDGMWFKKAVDFIAARGITAGTGGGNFSPGARLTRAEFIVLMMRAYGIAPDENPADNFSDAGDSWYTGYLATAKRLGISAGIGNNTGRMGEQHPEDATSLYGPGNEITRQDMFTLLYNALKKIGKLPGGDSGKKLSDFADAGQINSWAKDAMAAFVAGAVISGSNGRLFPTGTATRAEMAQLLYNLLSQ